MRKGARLFLLLFILGSLAGLVVSPGLSQSGKRPRREKFGSSLKRLKWDPQKQALVEKTKKEDKPSASEEALTLKTLLVVFDVLVVDRARSRIVTGLTKDDFLVTEDDRPQQVATFLLGNDESRPRSIVLIIDWSASQFPYFDKSMAAARSLIDQLGPKDEIAIATDDVELITDFTNDKARLNRAIDSLEKKTNAGHDPKERTFKGRSHQFSALFATLREMTNDPDRSSIIIFQTDGDEAPRLRDQVAFGMSFPGSPPFGLKDIYAAAEKSRATIYSIITNEKLAGLSPAELEARARKIVQTLNPSLADPNRAPPSVSEEVLRLYMANMVKGQMAMVQVANTTGGWTDYLEKPEDAQRIYGQILSDINQRYVIGYYPTNGERDGKLRHVKIAIRDHPEYQTLGRKTYFAPAENAR